MGAAKKLIHEPLEYPRLDDGVFTVVLQAHRREGFDAGYRRALADVLAASVFVAEKSLLETHADSPDSRRLIYRLVELLERETIRFKAPESFSDGSGI